MPRRRQFPYDWVSVKFGDTHANMKVFKSLRERKWHFFTCAFFVVQLWAIHLQAGDLRDVTAWHFRRHSLGNTVGTSWGWDSVVYTAQMYTTLAVKETGVAVVSQILTPNFDWSPSKMLLARREINDDFWKENVTRGKTPPASALCWHRSRRQMSEFAVTLTRTEARHARTLNGTDPSGWASNKHSRCFITLQEESDSWGKWTGVFTTPTPRSAPRREVIRLYTRRRKSLLCSLRHIYRPPPPPPDGILAARAHIWSRLSLISCNLILMSQFTGNPALNTRPRTAGIAVLPSSIRDQDNQCPYVCLYSNHLTTKSYVAMSIARLTAEAEWLCWRSSRVQNFFASRNEMMNVLPLSASNLESC